MTRELGAAARRDAAARVRGRGGLAAVGHPAPGRAAGDRRRRARARPRPPRQRRAPHHRVGLARRPFAAAAIALAIAGAAIAESHAVQPPRTARRGDATRSPTAERRATAGPRRDSATPAATRGASGDDHERRRPAARAARRDSRPSASGRRRSAAGGGAARATRPRAGPAGTRAAAAEARQPKSGRRPATTPDAAEAPGRAERPSRRPPADRGDAAARGHVRPERAGRARRPRRARRPLGSPRRRAARAEPAGGARSGGDAEGLRPRLLPRARREALRRRLGRRSRPRVQKRLGGFARWKAGYAKTVSSKPRDLAVTRRRQRRHRQAPARRARPNCSGERRFSVTWTLRRVRSSGASPGSPPPRSARIRAECR